MIRISSWFILKKLTLLSKFDLLKISDPCWYVCSRSFEKILLSEAEGSLIIVLFQNHTLYGIDLVLADPFDGCSALRNMDEIAGSIALIQRGYDANV